MANQIGAGRYGLHLTFNLPGLPSTALALSRFADVIGDYREFWNGTFKTLWYEERRRDFALEGQATGPAWAALSPAYAAWKSRRFPGRPILTRSGQLRAAISAPDAPSSIWRAGPTTLEAGASVPYGIYHQRGTRRMPQRPPLRVDPQFMRVVGKSLQQFVVAAWQRARAAEKAAMNSIQGS